MIKPVKIRLYPNKEQEKIFSHHFGCSRWAYNYALNLNNEYYKENKKSIGSGVIGAALTKKKRSPEFTWLKDVDAQMLQQGRKNGIQKYTNVIARINA